MTTTATAYNTTSDYRLKTAVAAPDHDALETVSRMAEALRWYEWNAEPGKPELGWYAHELAEIEPRAVTGEKDGDEYQQRDDSKLIVHLVGAIAQLLRRVEELERAANPA